jgi:hypothetical protein
MDSIPQLVGVISEQHQMNKERAAAALAPRQIPVPPVANPPAQVNTVPMSEVPIWKHLLRQQGPRLVASAVAKHEPEVIAGTAILFAPPHVREALAEFFHREEAEVAADILVEVPAMAAHTEWLTEFVNAAQYRLFPEEFGEDEDNATVEDAQEPTGEK